MKVGIIGAGLSGLYAASFLAKKGAQVTIFEKNESSGGRSRTFTSGGFTFDMGPSWYWMPDLIDQLFNELGENRNEYYELKRLENAYQVFWNDNTSSIIPSDRNSLNRLFESYEPNGAQKLDKFLNAAKIKYELAQPFLRKPGLSLTELFDVNALKGATKLDVFKSVEKDVSKRFDSEKARSILNFPVLFLGGMPSDIPALYTLMNYADLELGTWYPEGGMADLAKALEKICLTNGVKFHFNSPVELIEHADKKVTGIKANGKSYTFDAIISGADYHHTEQYLLDKKFRRYDETYWNKRKLAPSALIFYLGFNRKLDGLEHHNLFFDEDLYQHGETIYSTQSWPDKPLFYACVPSITDEKVAPQESENVFLLMPIAPNINDEESVRDKYLNIMLDKIEKHTGVSGLKSSLVVKHSFCVSDFKNVYNSYKGNAYGLANTLGQTANLKPKIKSKLKNLYFCGQLTVPGPGIPPALISGQIAAKQLLKDHERTI